MGRATVIALMSLLCVAVLGGVAAGQDKGKDAKKSDIPDKPKALVKDDADKKKKADEAAKAAEELRAGPSSTLADAQAGRDPAETKKLLDKIRRLNQSQIDKLQRILDRDPDHPRRADMMFQKAELTYEVLNADSLVERAEWMKCLEAAEKKTVDVSSCKEPVPDYSEALDIYKAVLQQFPSYPRLDEVIFRLGDGLMKAEKKKEAISFLTRLVKNYPKSKYLPDAYVTIGDFWFDQKLLVAASDSYKEALKFKGTPLAGYANYKLAWVLYNQGEFREAVNTFKDVIELVEKAPPNSEIRKLSFANQALNDLIVSWAEIDGGWKEARDYLIKKKDKTYAKKKLRQMASLYENDGKNEPRIELFEYMLSDDPVDPKAPDYWEAIIDARKTIGVREKWEDSVRKMIGYFDPKGKWHGANSGNERAINNARLMAEGYLAQLAVEYNQLADKENKEGDPKEAQRLYAQASKDYKLFLEKFPESDDAYNIRFYRAQILAYELKDYEEAARQYKMVADAKADGEHHELSTYGVLNAYENLVTANHPKSAVVRLANNSQRQEAVETPSKAEEMDKDAQKKERSELFKWEKPFVEASDAWAKAYPKKEETPTVMFVAAEVYREHGQYDKAVGRYDHIIEFAPKHRYASFAGNSLLECYNELGEWAKLEKQARFMLERKMFDVNPKENLQGAIAFAISQKANDLQEEKRYDEAAEEMLRLANEWPKSDLAPTAIFNAAAIYERGDKIKLAVANYEKLIKEYPNDPKAPEALFVMGAIFEARTDFERAAGFFERVGDNKKWREDLPDKSRDAVYNSGVIREALEEWKGAIATYEKFIKLYPKSEQVPELAFHIAELHEQAGDEKEALKAYKNFIRKYKDKKDKHVHAYLKLGLIGLKNAGDSFRARKAAMNDLDKAIATWKALEDEKEKKATRTYAARAMFIKAEQVFEDSQKITLAFPDDVLVATVTKRGELVDKAQTLYFEAIALEDPLWTAAAAYRVGQMYKEFAEQLYALPIPEGLPPEVEEAYRFSVDDLAFPLQEKALTAFQTAVKLALKLRAYNEWSAKSAKEMSRLEKEAYPITEQDGVAIEHASEVYLRSRSFGMGDVKERAEDAAKAPAKPEPPTPPTGAQSSVN